MRYCTLFFLFFTLLLKADLGAQQVLLDKTIPDARTFTVDETGAVYVVFEDNSIVKYSNTGDSLLHFRSVQNGTLTKIDATNPLKLLLFYPDFSKIVVLDRMLAVKNEIDLKKIGIYNASIAGMSMDGNIWIFDQNNAQLSKINEQLQIVNQSEDLRQLIQTYIEPNFLTESQRKVYIADGNKMMVFDQFGVYLNTIDLSFGQLEQVLGATLLYNNKIQAVSYELEGGMSKFTQIVNNYPILAVRVSDGKIYYLYKNRIIATSIAP
jgi:hypothetical protein